MLRHIYKTINILSKQQQGKRLYSKRSSKIIIPNNTYTNDIETKHSFTYNNNNRDSIRFISSTISITMPSETQQTEQVDKTNDHDNNLFLDDDKESLLTLAEFYSKARDDCSNKWLNFGKTCHIYLYRGGGEPNNCLSAFDLDGTIIKPKSNKRIPKSATDWELFSVWTKVKLQQILRETNSRFVIFTNQNGVGLRLVALEEVQERIELVTKRLNIPCTVFVATDKDEFRKPNVGMFKLLEKAFNDSIEIESEKSFYCGDAVGYPSHSDADLKFAQRLNLPFLAPEKFLRGVKPKLITQ